MPKSVNLRGLTKLISWLDGYAALACVDPVRIEKQVKTLSSSGKKDHEGKDIASAWQEIRKDVFEIAKLPGSSEEIAKASKRLGVVKLVFTFMGVGVIAVYLVLSTLGLLTLSGTAGRLELLIAVIIAYNAALFAYVALNRRFNSLVGSYYDKHATELARQRRHVKAVTQRVIDSLAARIRAQQIDPEKYKLSLFDKEYSNINILGQDKRGIKYVASVKGRLVKTES